MDFLLISYPLHGLIFQNHGSHCLSVLTSTLKATDAGACRVLVDESTSGKPVLPGGSSRWLCTCAQPFCACLQVSTVHCDANLITRRGAADANSVHACMEKLISCFNGDVHA